MSSGDSLGLVRGGGRRGRAAGSVCDLCFRPRLLGNPAPPPILTGTAGRHNPPPPHLPQGFRRPADPASVLKRRGELGAQVFTGFAHSWSAVATAPHPLQGGKGARPRVPGGGPLWSGGHERGLQMQEGQPGSACEQAGQFCGGTSAGPAAGRPLAWVWKSRCRAKGPSVVLEHRWHTVALNDTSEKGTSLWVAPEATGSGQP